ncbi:tRNA (adenosine(37)-N6)-threonylcarbamoyltransferase complex dimerization subunit type 1 TsaB [Aristophania vespae]|uniref:tRNA (adenosine(37)-N6)-threonylcarbamoyltransferase complex dimerization subunit type 1 TsaB n=1 Tax=Aristophania vespae TaxID=2697033 RepID=UPI00235196E0|nr:tRNA (adenosine(37)-N6)-threonylcarbamoyltransferase complex dimerization subunit type 1 TsaB [Aristophania vespae]UMM64153.1 hypothetical protein DM15PD_11450 [Aristophania vespae]
MPLINERCIIINGAGAGSGQSNLIALIEKGEVVASMSMAGRGASERFAPGIEALLEQVHWKNAPDKVIAVTGPGSFTGLRASLSLASGLARGWNCPTIAVRLGEALRMTMHSPEAVIICLARRGRVFIDPPGQDAFAVQIDELCNVNWPLIAGDAVWGEDALKELIEKKGHFFSENTKILPYAAPDALGIYRAAQNRTPSALEPLYIDPPEARLPSQGLRPLPV